MVGLLTDSLALGRKALALMKGWLKWRESGRRGDTVRDRVIFGLFREPGIFLSAWLRPPVGRGLPHAGRARPRGARHASDL